jgi:hypothetical protein
MKSTDRNTNPLVQLLSSGSQNTIGQVINSISQEFNKMNEENIDKAVSSKIINF